MKLASVVVFVCELDRSVRFYSELLGLTVTIRNDTAALLVSPDGSQLYLRCTSTKGAHPLGALGPQYMLWTAGSEPEFDSAASTLRAGGGRVHVTDEQGFHLLETRDPDDLPLMITFPGPNEFARDRIISRIYDW